jgi:cyclophilin family peptidyl-prolyl cis-trans isomerase
MPRVALTLVLVLLLATAGCGGDDASDEAEATTTEATETEGSTGCSKVEAPAPRKDGDEEEPSERLDPERTWTLTFDTSCGRFVVTLDTAGAPATTASLVALAEDRFFDNTLFHRVVPGFVIQGGDPTQTGTGGPGYSTVDAPASDTTYVRGVVAMAKTAAEPPGTAGSQFFVVTGTNIGLPPEYAVVGRVTEGLDVALLIDAIGDPTTEQPLLPVVIESVTAASSG